MAYFGRYMGWSWDETMSLTPHQAHIIMEELSDIINKENGGNSEENKSASEKEKSLTEEELKIQRQKQRDNLEAKIKRWKAEGRKKAPSLEAFFG